MSKPDCRDVEVEIRFLTTEEGGRVGPSFSGFRIQFYYDGGDWDCMLNYIDHEDPVDPGETVRAHACFTRPVHHVKTLHVGKPFQLREGQRVIAEGKVLQILDLEASAKRLESFRRSENGI